MDADADLTLFPDLPMPDPGPPRWDVTFTVRRRDGGEPLYPIGVPAGSGAMACWNAKGGQAVVTVVAETEPEAWAAALRACPGWAELPGVTVTAARVKNSRKLPFSTSTQVCRHRVDSFLSAENDDRSGT